MRRKILVSLLAAISAFASLDCSYRFHRRNGTMSYNLGREPSDWWQAIRDYHGHVGPWNVLGYRIGKRALKEFGERWGSHALDITCYVPLRTPFTCMADGLTLGTGNTLGRLDIRLAEAPDVASIRVAVRRKTGDETLIFTPRRDFLDKIAKVTDKTLDALAHECADLPDEQLFAIGRE